MRISRPTELPKTRCFVAPEVDISELQRVIRIVSLAVPRGPITFSGGANLLGSWQKWQSSVFLPTILPRFLKAIEFARREQARELAALDLELGLEFPLKVAMRSSAAGSLGLQQLLVARGIPWVRRYESGVVTEQKRGQYAVSYAIACGLFNVGTWNSVLALLCEELAAASGQRASDLPAQPEMFAQFLDPEPLRVHMRTHETSGLQFHVA